MYEASAAPPGEGLTIFGVFLLGAGVLLLSRYVVPSVLLPWLGAGEAARWMPPCPWASGYLPELWIGSSNLPPDTADC